MPAALAGSRVSNHDPAVLAIRRLVWLAAEAGTYLGRAPRRGQPPAQEDELELRRYRAGAAEVLLLVLAGKYHEALSREIAQQRYWDPEGWRERALADLSVVRSQAGQLTTLRHEMEPYRDLEQLFRLLGLGKQAFPR
jgi:hypothetical protein